MKTNGLKSDDYDTIGAGNIMTPYSVEVNPKELKKEPKSLSDLYFSNIEVIGSNYAGYEQWDGNFDIPKLKYNLDNSDNLSSKNNKRIGFYLLSFLFCVKFYLVNSNSRYLGNGQISSSISSSKWSIWSRISSKYGRTCSS